MKILEQLEKGITLLQLKKNKQARDIFEKVIASDPGFSLSYTLLSYSYLYESNYKDTLKFAERALELDANNAENHYLKGAALKGLNDFKGAIQHIETAIEIDPKNDIYYLQLSNAYARQEIIGKAITLVKKALEINPNNPNAYGLLSYLEGKYKGKKGDSEEYLMKGLEIDPHNQMLKQLSIDKAVSQAKSDISIHLSEQLLTEDPSDWGFRQLVLDSHLSKFSFYRWLVLKYRVFNELNYFTILLSLTFMLFLGLILRPKNAMEPYYNFARIIGGFVAFWTLIFWTVRCIGQTYMKNKLWSFEIKQLLDTELLIQCQMILSTFSLIVFVITTQNHWFGYAFFLSLLSVWSLPLFFQDNEKLKFYKIYLFVVYTIGILLFFIHYFDSKYLNQISDLFVAVLFIPVFGFIIVASIFDSIRDYKKSKSNTPTTREEKPIKKRTLFNTLPIWIIFPIYIVLQLSGTLLGANIFDTVKFLIIWGIIALLSLFIAYRILQKIQSPMLDIISETKSAEEQLNNLVVNGISIVFIIFIIGISTTAYFPYGQENWHQLKIEQHGLELEKRKTNVVLRKENGWKVSLKPNRNALYESEFKSCINVKIKNSFLGVRYATDFEQCPQEDDTKTIE